MTTPMQNLQQIKGIGRILAKRLCEAGIDSFAAITSAGEAGLKAINGITPRMVQSILEQSSRLQAEVCTSKAERLAAVKGSCHSFRNSVQVIAESARQRLSENLSGKPGEKLTTALVRLIDTLDKVEETAHKRVKRAGKAVAKAEQRIEKLVDAEHKDLRKGLKKARKSLRRALA
jgi:predicted flap endonuclease-1-like 5' DNA nuclease